MEQAVKTHSRTAPVLLLAREDGIEQVVSGLKAGARGVVKQTATLRELRLAIAAVAKGGTPCDPKLFQRVMRYLPTLALARTPSLTQREEEVLRYVTLGETNKEIAQRLGISEPAIKVHVSNLLRKCGTSTRSGLAMFASTRGLMAAA